MVTNSGGGGGGSQDRSTGSKVLDGGSCGSDGEIKRTTMLKKGPWTAAEDAILKEYVEKYGEGNWNAVQRNSGLARCGKSCRLRWANHLRPNLKKGAFSPEEERLILELHAKLGNKWARMAAQLPGRTDNEIKNYWNTRVKRRLRQGLPLYPQEIQFRTSPYHHQNNITQTQNLLPTSPSSNSPTHHSLPPHNSSLSIFDSNSPNSATHFFTPLSPPPISLPFNQFKRYHNPNVEFSFNPISSNPQPSSPLGHYMPSPLGQSMFTQIPHISSFSFGYANFDQNSYQPYQTQFKSDDGLIPSTGGLAFSIKPELPSNQIFPTKMQCDTDMKKDMNVAARHESGLLDDLLRESQTMSSDGQSRRRGLLGSDQENCMFDGFPSHWDDSGSIASSSEMKTKEEPAEQNNFMHEDFSNSLNIMPPTMKDPLWFSTTEEISNGQSSGGVDSLGIDLQQSTSSLPITTSNWDNMPGFAE